MASSNNITNIYESYAELSFVDKKNFKHNISPTLIVGAFIPCINIDKFYCDTLLYLHLFASLYYELNYFIINNNNNITLFKKCIDKLQIQIINGQITDNSNSHVNCIGYLNAPKNSTGDDFISNPIFKFSLTTFKSNYITSVDTAYKDYDNNNNKQYNVIKPILENLSVSNNIVATTPTVINLFGLPAGSINTDSWSKTSTSTIDTGEYSPTYDTDSRYKMIKKIIKGILQQGHENIMSYLLYYTIYYHIIAYNTCIQNEINHRYLHNNKYINTGTPVPLKTFIEGNTVTFNSDATYYENVNIVKTLIISFRNNVSALESKYLGSGSVDYIDNKSKYASKIEVLNDIKIEFDKIQNELNITIKEYNKYIKNFQKVKTYANFIIIVLIAIIIITILVTVLDSITPNFKNYYYVIAFIILAFITFVYYNNFSHINLYERFTNVYIPDTYDISATSSVSASPITGNISACIQNTFDLTDPTKVNGINTHINYINKLSTELNSYNESINNIMNGLRTNIYTANYGIFTKDGNTYLYNLYIEKKNQNESNRIKKVALANMLDTMKRHIVYLFNIILLISLLTIILLFGLILFSNFPFYLNYIIILCIILISIIIIYFINSIVQPTRMLVNKNYWANKNPSKILLAKV